VEKPDNLFQTGSTPEEEATRKDGHLQTDGFGLVPEPKAKLEGSGQIESHTERRLNRASIPLQRISSYTHALARQGIYIA